MGFKLNMFKVLIEGCDTQHLGWVKYLRYIKKKHSYPSRCFSCFHFILQRNFNAETLPCNTRAIQRLNGVNGCSLILLFEMIASRWHCIISCE